MSSLSIPLTSPQGPTPCKSSKDDKLPDSGLRRMSAKLARLRRMAQDNKPPAWALLIAIITGSGGTAALLPKFAPDWYRPDPATGEDVRAVRSELESHIERFEHLQDDFREFLREGPREVRVGQDRMNQKLDRLIEEIKERGHEHRRAHGLKD